MGCHGGKVVVCTDDGQVSLMRNIATVQMALPVQCPIALSLIFLLGGGVCLLWKVFHFKCHIQQMFEKFEDQVFIKLPDYRLSHEDTYRRPNKAYSCN